MGTPLLANPADGQWGRLRLLSNARVCMLSVWWLCFCFLGRELPGHVAAAFRRFSILLTYVSELWTRIVTESPGFSGCARIDT